MEKTVLHASGITKTFSNNGVMQHVLRNVDLAISSGDFVVIMGASGAGKSTLLYVLSGMDSPTLGTIRFGDEDLTSLSTDQMAVFRRTHCGFVFQQIELIGSMTIADNIMCAGLLATSDRAAIAEKTRTLFEDVALGEDILSRYPAQISGGQAQRAGIVRALINDPEIMFADEPTGALNFQTGTDVLDTLTHFNERGQTVVMVTHDVRSARRANRILYLRDGAIIGECSLGRYQHADRMRHERLLAFLAEMGW